MSSTRQDMRPAREGLRRAMRQRALDENPTLAADADALEARVDELILDVRRFGGRVAAAGRRAKLRTAERLRQQHVAILDQAQAVREQHDLLLELIYEAADPYADCVHDWPGDLGEDPFCQRCGLPYADYTEKEVAA